jgi:hypothetical protein
MRTILPLALFLAIGPGLPSCNDSYGLLLAKQIENRGELVGGPVAMADIGDFLLQNDQIRVNILGAKDSPGPGVFGGSVVDIDIRRDRLGFGDGQGHDRFAEMFPVANLLVPNPKATEVTVLSDGSNGKEAAIRVEGEGAYLFEALSILHTRRDTLRLLFPDVKTVFRFRTDYILRPGDRHITMKTALMLEEPPADNCPDPSMFDASKCEFGLEGDVSGCVTTDCAQPISLDHYHLDHDPNNDPEHLSYSVFGQIFGDDQNNVDPKPIHRGGVVAGDFVFFGNQNDIFAPGIGFDTDTAVHEAFYAGRNTFQDPLRFDFVSASGGDISYAYFTVPNAGEKAVAVNVPIFTSAATAFLSTSKSCLFDKSDDATCDSKRAFTFERYLAVGDGDIASVSDEVWKVRKTPVGEIKGVVQWRSTGEPAPKAHILVFTDPQRGKAWSSVDELTEANYRSVGSYGLINVIDADVGLDLVLDGDFHATLPAGDYVIVARSEDGMGLSTPQSLTLKANDSVVLNPALVTPGTVEYRISDEVGNQTPAKIAMVSLDDKGRPLEGDGKRRVFLGDSRLGNGVRAIDYSTSGRGSIRVEPGRYRFRASRGPEYGIFEQDLTIDPGIVKRVDGTITHEVDTAGWMSADMHLHSQPSFDSGMLLPKRISTIAAEHLEFAVPTDHDVETDYGPTIRSLFMEPYVATAVGAETTTIELGHFISFPLRYDATIVPTHGSHDPTCETGGQIIDALNQLGEGTGKDYKKPFTILAHPRDGFFGYMYQLGVDPFTMRRQVSTLELTNPVFTTATCDFEGMELINGKRFDLVRTATIEEVVDWNRCRARIDGAKNPDALKGICPEFLAPTDMFAPCDDKERWTVCQARNRTAASWASMKRMLARTPEEQEAQWNFPLDTNAGQPLCGVAAYGQDPVPRELAEQPCTFYSGHVDDYFRYLEHGMVKTQIASSDSHDGVHEPGYPRTYFQSPTDYPAALRSDDVLASLRGGHAVTSYGPFISAKIGDKTFGDIVPAKGASKVSLDLTVQTASWFGVDRIEVYQNGHLIKVISPKSKPEDIIDFTGKLEIPVPPTRDSWIVVIAMGLEDRNLMRPVTLDIPYGEVQISKVTSDAFSLIPVVNSLFSPVPTLPDWFPIPAYAVSNPIYLDVDGNNRYDAPLPYPDFCTKTCDPNASTSDCPLNQGCVSDAMDPTKGFCGTFVSGKCEHRNPWPGGGEMTPLLH